MSALAGLGVDLEALERLSPEERERVAGDLVVLEREVKQNPLLVYWPHPKQSAFHRPPFPPLRAFFGGNRSGKTTSAMVDTIIQCVDRDVVPAHLVGFKRWEPPFKCRVMTPDFGDTHEVVLEKLREWCPKGQLKGGSFDRAYDKQKRVLWFKNESRLHFNSNVQDREQLGGSDLQRVLYDEEPRRDLRVESLTRLIDHDGEEIFAMTPLEGMSWMYDEIYEPWERGEADDEDLSELERRLGMRVLVVDMDDNPHLSEAGKARALQAYSGEEREARKSGRFVSFAGLIYSEFKSTRHVIPDAPLPGEHEVFVGIDAGLKHPAVVYCYLTPRDEMVVFDELAPENVTIATVCKLIKQTNAFWKVQPRWYIIDPAARNRNSQTGRSDQDEFSAHGIPTVPGQNDVKAGINKVKQRLEVDPPRLQVMAKCDTLRSEFKRYRYKRDTGRTESEVREAPVKKNDHCFPAGTLVDTELGRRPIETIRPGERVWTRRGLFPALLAGKTEDSARTRVLRLEDGTELCGTGNHPIYVSGRGWTPLDSVRYGDTLLVWQEAERKSSGTGSSSTAIRTPRARKRGCTSPQRRSGSIVRSGSSTTVRFPWATTSTTLTGTPLTTTSPTLSASRPANTSPAIGMTSAATASESGCGMSSGQRQPHGTVLLTGSSGTASTLAVCSQPSIRFPTDASNVVQGSRARSAATCASARTTASRRGVERLDSMTWIESASGAATTTAPTATPSPRLAPSRVVENSRGANVGVYNLTILGPPEYFANGVLVHNCLDALRYVVMAKPMVAAGDRDRPSDTYKDRLLRQSLRRLRTRGGKTADTGFGPGQFSS